MNKMYPKRGWCFRLSLLWSSLLDGNDSEVAIGCLVSPSTNVAHYRQGRVYTAAIHNYNMKRCLHVRVFVSVSTKAVCICPQSCAWEDVQRSDVQWGIPPCRCPQRRKFTDRMHGYMGPFTFTDTLTDGHGHAHIWTPRGNDWRSKDFHTRGHGHAHM